METITGFLNRILLLLLARQKEKLFNLNMVLNKDLKCAKKEKEKTGTVVKTKTKKCPTVNENMINNNI